LEQGPYLVVSKELEAGRPRPFGRDDRSYLKNITVGLCKAWRLRML